MTRRVFALELDACRNDDHEVCQRNQWVHLKCTCPCHQDNSND